MWSKQADTTSAASTRDNNKNMTSFRKITNRKRKNSKSNITDSALSGTGGDGGSEKSGGKAADDPNLASKCKQKDNDTAVTVGVVCDKKHQSKNSKNRNKNRTKKDVNNVQLNNKIVSDTTVRVINKELNNKIIINNDSSDKDFDVVLRHHPSNGEVNNSSSAKRYSDSFVIENEIGQMKIKEENQIHNHTSIPPALTRAVSGFFIIDHARKANRRLSDLFRPSSTIKLSTSVENLKSIEEKNKIIMEKDSVKKTGKESSINKKLLKNDALNNKNASSKTKKSVVSSSSTTTTTNNNNTPKIQSPKVPLKKDSSSLSNKDSSSSYLKRVKSKIYKSKSDSIDEVDNNSESKSRKLKPKKSTDLNGRIPEETEAVLTPNGLRKSLTHFDFRLPRQTSNLERVRPKTYSAKITTDEDSEKENIFGKPIMEKSKSSSAINLSLWKSKRNKLMEQMASKTSILSGSSQDVQNEFDFIAFGSVNNIARSGGGGGGGAFGSQTSLQKQPSWLHIHKACAEGKLIHYFPFIYHLNISSNQTYF